MTDLIILDVCSGNPAIQSLESIMTDIIKELEKEQLREDQELLEILYQVIKNGKIRDKEITRNV